MATRELYLDIAIQKLCMNTEGNVRVNYSFDVFNRARGDKQYSLRTKAVVIILFMGNVTVTILKGTVQPQNLVKQ